MTENKIHNKIHISELIPSPSESLSLKDSVIHTIESIDDSIIHTYTDLDGIQKDGFNDSYHAWTIWSESPSNEIVADSCQFMYSNDILFKFQYNEVIRALDSISSNEKRAQIIARWYLEVRDSCKVNSLLNCEKITKNSEFVPFMLCENIQYEAYFYKLGKKVSNVMIETYETEFSGGKKYYLIDDADYLISKISMREWIR